MAVVNQEISDWFELVDNSDVAITGKVQGDFATVSAFDVLAPGTTAAVTLTEIGNGLYSIRFTPTTPTTGEDRDWGAYVRYSSGGVTRTWSETYPVTAVASTVTVVSTVTAPGGVTLRQIRRDVSDLLGNMLLVTCTDAGLTTTAIDTANLGGPNNAYAGREAYVAEGTGANIGLSRFITASTQSTKSIAFAPLTQATAEGDVIEIHNIRSSGWTKAEIHRAINMALVDATQALWSKDREDIATAFDQDTPTVTVPSSFYAIYGVHWQDDDGLWHEIDAAEGPNAYGWWLFQGERELVINGTPRSSADEHTVRIYGYKQYAALSADTDTTLVNAEWLRHQTCAYLCMQGRERIGDVSRERAYLQFQGRADRVRDLLSGPPEANTVLVL